MLASSLTRQAARPALPAHHHRGARRGAAPLPRQQRARAQGESEGEPDWDAEVKLFKQRTLAPNQLEVQRQLAAEQVDVGRVSVAPRRRRLPPAAAGRRPA